MNTAALQNLIACVTEDRTCMPHAQQTRSTGAFLTAVPPASSTGGSQMCVKQREEGTMENTASVIPVFK